MDEHGDVAGSHRSERTRLWRALVIASGSTERATESMAAVRTPELTTPPHIDRLEMWCVAFDHLDETRRSEFELLVGDAMHGPIRDLCDRLAVLGANDARALLAHHLGGFEADEVATFARSSAGGPDHVAAQREHRHDRDAEVIETSSVIRDAEQALNRLSDQPVGLQFALATASMPPDGSEIADHTATESRVRRLALSAVAACCVAAIVALAVSDGGPGEPPPRSTPGPETPLAVLPTPSPCRVAPLRNDVSASPSALKATTDQSLDDVLESTESVVRGRLNAVSARDGWVTFDVERGQVIDGNLGDLAEAFSMPGRMPSSAVRNSDLEFVAFVARDRSSPVGWSAPVRGGIWVACGGGRATSLGDSTPVDSGWLVDPTLATIEAAVTNRREDRRTMTLTAIDAETVAGGIRLRDGTGLSVLLPRAIDTAALRVEMLDDRTTSLNGPGVRVTLSVEPCGPAGADSVADRRATDRSAADCVRGADVDLVATRPLSADERGTVEGFVIDRGQPRRGAVLRVAPDGHLVAIDASTLLPRWRSTEGPAAPMGLTNGVAVASIGDDLVGFEAEVGEEIWSIAGAGSARVVRTDSSWLLASSEGATPSLRSIDPATGAVSWRLDGLSGVDWSSASATENVLVLAEWTEGAGHRLFGIDLASGRRTWSVDLGNGDTGSPRFAVDADRSIAIAFDDEDRLVRIDAETGREVWRTSPLRGLTIENIWPNSVTLHSSDRRITVGLTAGFLLPP